MFEIFLKKITSEMAKVELKNISKAWGSFLAVDNFDLTINDEEFLVLLGPSGCGKSCFYGFCFS